MTDQTEKIRKDVCDAESMTVRVDGYRQTHTCSLMRGHRGEHYCAIHDVAWGNMQPPTPIPPDEWLQPSTRLRWVFSRGDSGDMKKQVKTDPRIAGG